MRNIVLLGASGSIGVQTIDVIDQHSEQFNLVAVSVGNNVSFLSSFLNRHSVRYVCLKNEKDASAFAREYPNIEFFHGDEGLLRLADLPDVDLVINALQGFVGLKPTVRAIRNHRNIALANKETLVVAGQIITALAKEYCVDLIPIDSEHSAIFQCLQGSRKQDVRRLIITASGGSLRDLSRDQLNDVTIDQVLAHPNWSMGRKITVDSATMMNKGFEVHEAHWLFDIDYDHIETVLHPQSIVHSLVEFNDHSILCQLGVSDMRIPIQYALLYPDRSANDSKSLDLTKTGHLDFLEMDLERYPLLGLAYETGRKGGNLPAVMNGANEEAVRLFLSGQIRFIDIEEMIFRTVETAEYQKEITLESVAYYDRWAKNRVDELKGMMK